jgi:hypothetical protein
MMRRVAGLTYEGADVADLRPRAVGTIRKTSGDRNPLIRVTGTYMANHLRIIERTDGGPPIEAFVEDRGDGTRVLTHVLPFGVVLETILWPDGGLEVYVDGRLQTPGAGTGQRRLAVVDSPAC